MSPSSLSPPPPHPLPTLTLTCSLCFPLTRWSSHLFRVFLQVLLHRAHCQDRAPARRPPVALHPARVWGRRPPVLPRPLRLTRFRGPRPPVLPRPLRLTRVRGRRPLVLPRPLRLTRVRGPHLIRGSPCRCACTSAVRGRLHCLGHHRRPLLHRGHRYHHRSPRLPVSCHRCTTHRSFTDTHTMFTLW
jgi:hypothetical protein